MFRSRSMKDLQKWSKRKSFQNIDWRIFISLSIKLRLNKSDRNRHRLTEFWSKSHSSVQSAKKASFKERLRTTMWQINVYIASCFVSSNSPTKAMLFSRFSWRLSLYLRCWWNIKGSKKIRTAEKTKTDKCTAIIAVLSSAKINKKLGMYWMRMVDLPRLLAQIVWLKICSNLSSLI